MTSAHRKATDEPGVHAATPVDALTIPQVESERPWATERYLRRLVFERRVSYFKIGRRVLISLADLDEVVARGRVEANR